MKIQIRIEFFKLCGALAKFEGDDQWYSVLKKSYWNPGSTLIAKLKCNMKTTKPKGRIECVISTRVPIPNLRVYPCGSTESLMQGCFLTSICYVIPCIWWISYGMNGCLWDGP